MPGLDGTFDLDVPSVGKLAAWLGQPLDESQPDPGPLNVHAVLAADGDKVALNEATIKGKALMVNAKGSFDGSGAVAQFAADVVIELADLNAYLPPEEEGGEAAEAAEAEAAPAGEKAEGWSEEPIDFSALSLANGEAKVTIGKILYKELTIENGVISVTMLNGVLTAAIDGLAMAGGTVDTKVTVDASQPMAAVAYQAAIVNMQALPLLRTFAGTDRLSGTANLKANGQAVGSNQKQFVETLNGGGGFAFLEGAIHGINIAEAIRSLGSLGFGDEGPPQKTDFAEISGSFTIVDGLLENRDFQMLAPLLRVTGAGLVPMPPRTVNYNAELKLVASTEGQGGDAALAGLPIPVAITGPGSDPSYGVDWGSLLGAAALDPARLAAMPDDMLEAATGFGIDLPGLGGGDSGIGGLLDSVIGGSGDSSRGQRRARRLARFGDRRRFAGHHRRGARGGGRGTSRRPRQRARQPVRQLTTRRGPLFLLPGQGALAAHDVDQLLLVADRGGVPVGDQAAAVVGVAGAALLDQGADPFILGVERYPLVVKRRAAALVFSVGGRVADEIEPHVHAGSVGTDRFEPGDLEVARKVGDFGVGKDMGVDVPGMQVLGQAGQHRQGRPGVVERKSAAFAAKPVAVEQVQPLALHAVAAIAHHHLVQGRVDLEDVVVVVEVLDRQFPVAAELEAHVEGGVALEGSKIEVRETVGDGAHVVVEGRGLAVEIDEHPVEHAAAAHRKQTGRLGFMDAGPVVVVGPEVMGAGFHHAVEVVGPAVIGAGQELLSLQRVADQAGAAVGTDVVKDPHRAVRAAH